MNKTIPTYGIPSLFRVFLTLAVFISLNVRLMAQNEGTVRHLVEAKETFYSISKQYNVSIDNLKAANPGVVYPKIGEYLNIPGQPGELKGESTSVPAREEEYIPVSDCKKDKRNLSRTYHVALMVPLNLESVATIDTLLTKTPMETMNLPPFRFIQFYQGFLMAADTLADKGLNLELTVIDADQDQSKAERAIASGQLQDMDLIIGPFFKNAFSGTSAYASENAIPIVNPLSARDDILPGNPSVFKIVPSRITQVPVLESLVNRRFTNSNIFIVKENSIQGTEMVDSISSSLEEILGKRIPIVNYSTDSLPGVRSHLENDVHNLVIMYSENGVLPVQLLPALTEMSKKKEITIIGMPEWEKFDQVENKYLVTLGAYLFTDTYLDFLEPGVKQFIASFRSLYQAEPLDYAYAGYDAGIFFLSALMDYGRDFPDCARNSGHTLLHTEYMFRKIPGGGYDNTYWNVYHFQDYYQVEVPYLPKSRH
jgi:ABC-type branched-subunit amino acid transport system substrate-binding protein/LysM repeat protein